MFEPVAPYQRHSVTSLEAGESIKARLSVLQGAVLGFLQRCGADGATDEEMQDRLALNPSTQRPRRVELTHKGLIVEADFTRKTRSGRSATVWLALDNR